MCATYRVYCTPVERQVVFPADFTLAVTLALVVTVVIFSPLLLSPGSSSSSSSSRLRKSPALLESGASINHAERFQAK